MTIFLSIIIYFLIYYFSHHFFPYQLFVELQSILRKTVDAQVAEFFLGICDCATLRSWKLCSPELTRMSKTDCTFKEATAIANTSARVHRRLCDITFLSSVAPICNCSIQMAGQNLYKTEGSSKLIRI